MSDARYIPPPSAKQVAKANELAIAAFMTDLDRELEGFAREIRLTMLDIKLQFVHVGTVLNQAKAKLPHGQFDRWFERQGFEFSRRAAVEMMRVAQSDLIRDETFAGLPSTALAELTKKDLPPAAIEAVRALIKRRGGADKVRVFEVVEICKSYTHDEKVALAEIAQKKPKRRRASDDDAIYDGAEPVAMTDDGRRILPDISNPASRPDLFAEAAVVHVDALAGYVRELEKAAVDIRPLLRKYRLSPEARALLADILKYAA